MRDQKRKLRNPKDQCLEGLNQPQIFPYSTLEEDLHQD